jgi:hypothetical protein
MTRAASILTIALVIACGDNVPPALHYVELPDARTDATPDACVYAPQDASSCCDLLPDQAAFATCVAMPAGSCGVVICWKPDCSLERHDVCGPMADGGL